MFIQQFAVYFDTTMVLKLLGDVKIIIGTYKKRVKLQHVINFFLIQTVHSILTAVEEKYIFIFLTTKTSIVCPWE